jgi:hypothetical protein
LCSRLIQGLAMTQAREFADFWLRNSVHADEQFVARRNRKAVQALADKMIRAAKDQGFARDQMEAEIGDIYTYIRASIDTQNVDETARIKRDGSY